jgi:hypothetical protein
LARFLRGEAGGLFFSGALCFLCLGSARRAFAEEPDNSAKPAKIASTRCSNASQNRSIIVCGPAGIA